MVDGSFVFSVMIGWLFLLLLFLLLFCCCFFVGGTGVYNVLFALR